MFSESPQYNVYMIPKSKRCEANALSKKINREWHLITSLFIRFDFCSSLIATAAIFSNCRSISFQQMCALWNCFCFVTGFFGNGLLKRATKWLMSFITTANATYSFESSEIISKMLDQRLFWFCGLPRAPTKSQFAKKRETGKKFLGKKHL